MKKITIILFLLVQTLGFGQTKQANQMNTWITVSGNHKLTDKFSVYTMYSARRNHFIENWQQSVLRLGVNYDIKKNIVATLGYDWAVNFPYGEQPIAKTFTDHRIYEQLLLKNAIDRFAFTNGFRLEQRFLVNGIDMKYRNRFRYKLGLNVPLNHKEMEANTFYVAASDEIFMNFGNGIAGHNFDQNWFEVDLGYQFNKNGKVQLGYMNQFLPKAYNLHVENNHTFLISFIYNTDWRKK